MDATETSSPKEKSKDDGFDGRREKKRKDEEDDKDGGERRRRREKEREDEKRRDERRRDDEKRREDEKRRDDEKRREERRRRHAEEKRRGEENDSDRGDRRRQRSASPEKKNEEPQMKKRKPMTAEEENILTRTGGAYIPPAKLRMLQAKITDKTSTAYQRMAWEALKKSLNGLINKVNVSNVAIIIRELFRENTIRGRGLLTRSILQAQVASPTFTHVYACLVAIINSKFPQIGELILKRLIVQFRQGFRRNDKAICLSSTRFIAHLVNQEVVHELLALEILTLLLEKPTDDAVEVAIGFLKECGQKLSEVTPRGVTAIFDRIRSILHESNLDKRVQYMIEVIFAIRKDKFEEHPSVISELDLVEEADQFTHLISLDDVVDGENMLNVFRYDNEYEENEAKYKEIRKELLEESSEDEGSGEEGEGGSEDEEEEEEDDDETKEKIIIDNTDTNLVSLRRTIYLTIQSSLDFEECAHKLLKMELKPGQETHLCHMILDCCAQQRTYEKFFGLLGQRFCMLNKIYVTPFEKIFVDSYETIHRLETNKLRNVAKFFSHLLYTDAISWTVLSHIHLNEEETTSSSRIFIKILFQELSEFMGLPKLNDRLKDVTLQEAFEGLFPRDNPRNTRFAINFFTSIGLGGLTDELREHLKTQPKISNVPVQAEPVQSSSSSSSSSSTSSSSSDSSDDSSNDSDSAKSESEPDVPVSRNKKSKGSERKTSKKSKRDRKISREKSKSKKTASPSPVRREHSRTDKSKHKTDRKQEEKLREEKQRDKIREERNGDRKHSHRRETTRERRNR